MFEWQVILFPDPGLYNTGFPVPGDNIVAKGYPKYMQPDPVGSNSFDIPLAPLAGRGVRGEGAPKGRVYINDKQYFDDVPQNVWEFHVGGYQVCEKWLKDRRGRSLSFEDRVHYRKITIALAETTGLMEEVDKSTPEWPVK